MHAEIASRAQLFVDNCNRPVRGTPDEFADLAVLVANSLDGTDHAASATVDAHARIDDVQFISVTGDRVNGAVRQARHASDALICNVVSHSGFPSASNLIS